MHNDFAYQCPHCDETIRIADDVMGGVVDCPVCGSPFKVDVPSARPADPNRVNGQTPSIDRPEGSEGELTTVHPAMFRPHPIKFIAYWAMLIVGAAGIIMAMMDYEFVRMTFQIAAGGLLAAIGGFLLAKWWLITQYTTLTVTTKRTILRKGIVAKQTTEVQHDDVRNIQIDQSIFERVMGVGDLAVSSSGQDDLEIHVRDIPEPNQVAEKIRDLQ